MKHWSPRSPAYLHCGHPFLLLMRLECGGGRFEMGATLASCRHAWARGMPAANLQIVALRLPAIYGGPEISDGNLWVRLTIPSSREPTRPPSAKPLSVSAYRFTRRMCSLTWLTVTSSNAMHSDNAEYKVALHNSEPAISSVTVRPFGCAPAKTAITTSTPPCSSQRRTRWCTGVERDEAHTSLA